jgi:hypothetical protein
VKENDTSIAVRETTVLGTGESTGLASMLEEVRGKNTTQRIVDILTLATRDRKLVWVRDAAWYAVCLVPFLAVSFRIKFPQDPSLYAEWPASGTPTKLDIVFMDGTRDISLLPGAGHKKELEALGAAVRDSFRGPFQRDRNERMDFLEAALRQFLPMVVSSDPREE